ncbi:PLP-dependent aminotransferase family protein [Pseudaquabacterium rugosum]|uniref:PLP-dependent aminotransferase family protein n=1 Tax=Pseudaquabacterium rugosum TaxID=2984194 RepID=A0ABU9BGV8_9BURK
MRALPLDPDAETPLVRQIVEALTRRIEHGELTPGQRLLSVRELARSSGVSTMTVINAYQRLLAEGLVTSRRASGYFVAERRPAQTPRRSPFVGQTTVDEQWMLRRIYEDGPELVRAGSAALPADWLDETGVRQAMAALSRKRNASPAHYGSPNGYLPLRQQIAALLAQRQILAAPHQIVLTHGASQALELITRVLLRPQEAVLVDDPGSTNLFAMLRANGHRLVGVPRRADGPDLSSLRTLALRHQARVMVLMTHLHNPTGSCCTPEVKREILKLARELDLRIVELDAMGGLEPPGLDTLAGLDGLQRVIHVGTFSKTLSPSLRVGHVCADEDTVERLLLQKMRSTLTSSELVERLLHTLLAEGRHLAHVRRLSDRLRETGVRVGQALASRGLQIFLQPAGGPFIWARLPGDDVDMRQVAQRAIEAGIMLAPGELFHAQPQRSPWTRLNVAYADDARVMDWLADEAQRGSPPRRRNAPRDPLTA